MCAFVYGFLLLEAVGHTAARSQAEGAIRSLSSELGELQSQYLNQTKEVTLSLATELGFVEPQETSVIFMSANALSLNYTNVPTQ